MENQNQQPAGEAQLNQKMPWYKKWWVILIAVLILLPFFYIVIPIVLIWLIWSKAKWSDNMKFLLTFTLAIFIIIGIAIFGSDEDKKEEITNQTQVPVVQNQVPTQKAPEPIKAVFDVPSLVGKNIDEIKQVLGEPTTFLQPTKQQLAITDIWDMEYTKEDTNLLITYNPKTKVVLDFFIDGEDKTKIMALGNLQEKNDAYVVEFVKNLIDQNKITGVKVYKKLPAELNASVKYNMVGFEITNSEDYNWANCRFELNGGGKLLSGGYEYKSQSGIKSKDDLAIPYSEFTKDSKRFSFFEQKPENLFIACDALGQHRTNYFVINN